MKGSLLIDSAVKTILPTLFYISKSKKNIKIFKFNAIQALMVRKIGKILKLSDFNDFRHDFMIFLVFMTLLIENQFFYSLIAFMRCHQVYGRYFNHKHIPNMEKW